MDKNIDLTEPQTAINFYDKRYRDGYMEEWDAIKKNKVREVLNLLNLPQKGTVLDFGCGNGVFTKILKECLPDWEVFGVEISPTAINNARAKCPDCHFFGLEDADKHFYSFDLLFSHHVIEHVQDLDQTFQIINTYLKPNSFQLHILPCGNAGSYEYNICMLKKGGLEKNQGNRFFFEEEGHLRRLNTQEFALQEKLIGFALKKEFYSNQYQGAINWITKSSPKFVKKLTDNSDAINAEAFNKLSSLRKKLLPLTYIQFPYSKYLSIKNKWYKEPIDYFKLIIYFIPAMFSMVFYKWIEKKSLSEWNIKKHEQNGSEMFLFFTR